jgi:putative membrane protein
MKKGILFNLVLWLLITLVFALTIYLSQNFKLFVDLNALPSMLLTFASFSFALIHCTRRYGWKVMLAFFSITTVCLFTIESLSIATGFPLGNFSYSRLLGVPMLLGVPVTMPIPAFTIVYLSWTMSEMILNGFSTSMKRAPVMLVPIVAAFIYAMWDAFADQHFSTSIGLWVYNSVGGRFGVPYVTVFGMFLYGYVIYQLFALFLSRYAMNTTGGPEITLQLQGVIFYLTYPASYLLAGFFAPDITAAAAYGRFWQLRDLYQTSGSIAFVTAIFVAFLAFVSIISRRTSRLEKRK